MFSLDKRKVCAIVAAVLVLCGNAVFASQSSVTKSEVGVSSSPSADSNEKKYE